MDQQNKETFIITVAFNGKHVTLHNITRDTTIDEIASLARETFDLPEETSLKFVMKGKVVGQGEDSTKPVFPSGLGSVSKLPPKIVIMATADQTLKELRLKRADPTIRGFDHEPKKDVSNRSAVWGPSTTQNREYKFCRLQACTWQSFGHRPTETTPHAFKAMQLLERISTDPGVVAIMIERELVVGTLGEMDPIDDRLMQKKAEQDGACLLGYNTNAGARIDIKLRTDDLSGFRAYPDLVATLIHELSHNWVGEHNALFWANYGQMRAEYLHKHASLAASGYIVNGKTSADLAGVLVQCRNGMKSILDSVMVELTKEMAQHGLDAASIASTIAERCNQLLITSGERESLHGMKLAGETAETSRTIESGNKANSRDLALAAAERRFREQQDKDKSDKKL